MNGNLPLMHPTKLSRPGSSSPLFTIDKGGKMRANPNEILNATRKQTYAPAARLPERVSQKAFRGVDGASLNAARDIARGSLRADGSTAGRIGDEQGRRQAHAAEQVALTKWATDNGKLIPEDEFNAKWEAGGKRAGAEHDVFLEAGRWFKRNLLNFHGGSIAAYLDRLALQKYYFPESDTRFEGFTMVGKELAPVISQRHAIGQAPSQDEIMHHLKSLGFNPVFETGGNTKMRQMAIDAGLKVKPLIDRLLGFHDPTTNAWIEDVHDENAVMETTTPRRLNVFDPVMAQLPQDKPMAYSVDTQPSFSHERTGGAGQENTFNPRTGRVESPILLSDSADSARYNLDEAARPSDHQEYDHPIGIGVVGAAP